MFKAFKYRLWTNENQERELSIALETHRRIWNQYLAQRIAAWECDRVQVSYFDQSKYWSADRKANPYFARLDSRSATQTLRRLDKAYVAFFRRNCGFPRFKGRGRLSSFEFNRAGYRLSGDRLYLHGIGTIRVKLHRSIEGTIKTVRLLLDAGKWYAIFACDVGERIIPKSTNPPVGVDVGLESFLTTSDGEHEPNPRFLRTGHSQIRRLSRSLCRKKKGGSNRRKARECLARAHFRVRCRRQDHAHKTALKLVRRYGTIAVESLSVQGMLRNHRIARSISDVGWSGFLEILKPKAESAGVEVIEVDARNTSQICSQCGQIVQKELKERWHACDCGLSIHRDVNAACNILARGLVRTEPAGCNVRSVEHIPKSLIKV